jgi:3-deoxy-D-manno-octulosonate 8-phosphate phosphatase (KDO 8-P phosphatase)
MQRVGFACCPNDAAEEIREICDYISPKNGGEGCVRDIMEKVMKLQSKWFDEDSHHW